MLTSFKCPECGASLTPEAAANTVKCSYCHTTSAIRPPEDVGKPESTTNRPPGIPTTSAQPVNQTGNKANASHLLWALLTIMGVLVAVALFVMLGVHEHLDKMQWAASSPLILRDIDNDGTVELIGWIRTHGHPDGSTHIAAFDSVTGDKLWMTRRLGPHVVDYRTEFGIGHGLALMAEYTGTLHGFSLTTGEELWSVRLDERCEKLCEAEDFMVLVSADKRVRAIDPADGSLRPVELPNNCIGPREAPRFPLESVPLWEEKVQAPEGMEIKGMRRGPGTLRIVLGVKNPGTEIPMAAVVDGDTLLWAKPVATVDQLTVKEGSPFGVSLGGEVLIMFYAMDDRDEGAHIVARALKTGELMWTTPLPSSGKVLNLEYVAVSPDGKRLYVAHWTWLDVFAVDSGERLFRLGSWL